MANYPAPPTRRIAWDQDDTQIIKFDENFSGVLELTAQEIIDLNGEDDGYVDLAGGATVGPVYLCFIFPQAVQLLDARFIHTVVGAVVTVDCERSDDSTNGRDGAWTQEAAAITKSQLAGGVRPEYRNDIAAIGAAAAHTGWRFKCSLSTSVGFLQVSCCHLYALEHGPTHRLAFWKPVADAELDPDFNFEDLARGSSATKTFRVKNTSGSQTANNVQLTVESGPSHGSPGTWTLLSTDNITYSQSVSLGNLGPGTLSSVVYLKAAPPVSAELSTLSARVDPSVGSWS